MGGNRNGKNIFYKKSEGRKEFYHHDDRTSSDNYNKDFTVEREFYSGRRDQYQDFNDNRQYSSGKRDHYQKRGNFRGENIRGRGGKKFLNNEDVFMSDGKSRFQQMYGKGRGGARIRGRSRRVFARGYNEWSKLVLKDAGSYPTEEVINKLHELIEEDFVPIMLETEYGDLVFYLEKNESVARAITELSGRLVLGKKHRINIHCFKKPPPDRKLTEPHIEVIKKVMETRFSPEMNRLDLKKFHDDKSKYFKDFAKTLLHFLTKEKIFCPLYRRQCIENVMQIIGENCSHVEEIDLSWNGLFNDLFLSQLKKCPNLKRLYLEKNKFRSLISLGSLKGLGVTDLSLEGNPLCDNFKDAESYVKYKLSE
ncbi:Nuclear RNA export factor 5 [Armadillidium vulgare]|nr:Nuclear RNA export factor 5 [Armadillidium vulgare]